MHGSHMRSMMVKSAPYQAQELLPPCCLLRQFHLPDPADRLAFDEPASMDTQVYNIFSSHVSTSVSLLYCILEVLAEWPSAPPGGASHHDSPLGQNTVKWFGRGRIAWLPSGHRLRQCQGQRSSLWNKQVEIGMGFLQQHCDVNLPFVNSRDAHR